MLQEKLGKTFSLNFTAIHQSAFSWIVTHGLLQAMKWKRNQSFRILEACVFLYFCFTISGLIFLQSLWFKLHKEFSKQIPNS
jgi:hypothetical protein